ncbi:MAG: hypothetical protein U0359_09740 [Byssovorax sp.]
MTATQAPLAQRWLRATTSLRESALRVAYLRSEIERHPVDDLALALDEVCSLAEQADPRAREVLSAAVSVFADPAFLDRIEELRALAARDALLALGRLFRFRDEEREREAPVDKRRIATSATGRTLTLGERKSLARRPSRAAIERLLLDPDPSVIRHLLVNPRLTEDDVMRLVTRRPAHREAILEIARHPGWLARPRIRMAIVQNPGSPAGVSVPLVRLLIRPELQEVVSAADLPVEVRAAAGEQLERRPPVPEPDDPGAPQ